LNLNIKLKVKDVEVQSLDILCSQGFTQS